MKLNDQSESKRRNRMVRFLLAAWARQADCPSGAACRTPRSPKKLRRWFVPVERFRSHVRDHFQRVFSFAAVDKTVQRVVARAIAIDSRRATFLAVGGLTII